MTKLVDKNFKTAIINTLHTLMKVGHDIRRKVESIRNTQNEKKKKRNTQNELLEMQKIQRLKSATEYTLRTSLVTRGRRWTPARTPGSGSRSGRGGRTPGSCGTRPRSLAYT